MSTTLDNLQEILKHDSKNMRDSLRQLSKQADQIWVASQELKLPAHYKNFENIVFFGMGGSTLGAHVIKALYSQELSLPIEIINDYHTPNFVGPKTLAIVTSYSGSTEESISVLKELEKNGAKTVIIASGGSLQAAAKRHELPFLKIPTEFNPCGSPRMALGYLTVAQMVILAKAELLKIGAVELSVFMHTLDHYDNHFGPESITEQNLAKQLADRSKGFSVWYVAAEHLVGSAHIAANQMNENAKRFGGYFVAPELNHHLMEGLINPKNNHENLLFVLFESNLYDERVQKRFEVTKKVLEKNNIQYFSYNFAEKEKLAQVGEALALSGYASFYSAILEGIDPTDIPYVDFFKEQLKKK